jgi:hypothetical protein
MNLRGGAFAALSPSRATTDRWFLPLCQLPWLWRAGTPVEAPRFAELRDSD